MNPILRAIAGRLGIIIAVASLAGVVGCSDYRVDLGPTLFDDVTCPSVKEDRGANLSFVDGNSSVQGTLPVTSAQVLFPLVVIHGQVPDFIDGSLTVRVWAGGPGTYRCDDPGTAGRTRIVGLGSKSTVDGSAPVYWMVDTLSGGSCSISITHYPGSDGPSLEGSFTASGGGSVSFSGSFFVENPC